MITYYSDIKDLKGIHNPLIDNSTEMRHSGFFEVVDDPKAYFGKSIKKTLHSQGRIYCDDASKLFSISSGYIGLILSFPYNIQKGVLSKARFSEKEYMLWAVNMGQTDIGPPGIGVFLTKNGIEFRVKTSAGNYSLIDNQTTILSDQSFEIEFLWDKNGISIDESPTMLIRVNNENIVGGVIPIVNDASINSSFYTDIGQSQPPGTDMFSDVEFQILDNIYKMNNISCAISRIFVEDSIPVHFSQPS